MFKQWQPLNHNLESSPGLDLSIESRSLKIRLTNWRDEVCFFGLDILFTHAIAGLYVYDESTDGPENLTQPEALEFDGGRAGTYPAWVDKSNKRLALYGELGRSKYEHIDTYFFVGQSIVVLVDVADSEPTVLEIEPEVINQN